ncbi:hypothetical protein [Bradyrhizobium sp. 76]|uniref:hypothetical protein n=1 Tax=Bradyrhizobium sp. 76 TaxID=2782680 RepID=UPI001FF8AE85|nr:hypothetical protein [Bradyrhizobium sp. 76]MCK1404970.1 hypothetical protein [Bradyrhizobium sp. 76]
MSIEPIGLLTLLIGLICLQLGHRATFTAFLIAALLGSAAALLIGSANIQPAHLLLGFVAIAVFRRKDESATAMHALGLPKPGFWLMCLALYGVLTAICVPRLLAGITSIVPLGTSEYAMTNSGVPLGPVSSNFTQSVYMIGDLICFMMTAAIASTRTGFLAITSAMIASAAANLAFAVLDIATFSTGTQFTLEFIRNAQYTLHNEEEISGLKRIVGSFPEASAFARETLGALGFTGTLFLCGYRPALTGAIALASLVAVVLSTSSTGLAGTMPALLILYAVLVGRGFNLAARPYSSAAMICGPLFVAVLGTAILIDDKSSQIVRDYFDLLIFNKSTSNSGIERETWNNFGLRNFFDSYGIGVGLGTVRTSSLPYALLANVGVPGSLFYVIFLVSALFKRRGANGTFPSVVRLASRNACLSLIIGDCFAAPNVEQGLIFYVLAALACAEPEHDIRIATFSARRPIEVIT